MENVSVNYKIWIETTDGKGILGDNRIKLMKTIQETGSLMAACKKMDYSYRKTWNSLKELETKHQLKLIEKHRGGSSGGSTVLTKKGEVLVQFFDEFHSEADQLLKDLSEKLKERFQGFNF